MSESSRQPHLQRQAASCSRTAAICFATTVAYPPAVRQAGWVLATGVAVFFFIINLYTMVVLNLAVVALREKGHGVDVDGRVEYHELTAHIFPRITNAAFMFVALIGQLGTLASMTVFVVDQLQPLIHGLQQWQLALGMGLVVAPLCCLRTTDANLFQLAMQIGSAAVMTGMVTLVWYGAGPHGGFDAATVENDVRVDPHGLATAFSICAMMYSAHMESVSIEQDMQKRSSYLRALVSTQLLIGVLYMAFGVSVYFFFGAATGRVCTDDGSHESSLVCNHWKDETIFQNIPPVRRAHNRFLYL